MDAPEEVQPAFKLTRASAGPDGQSKLLLEVFLPGVQSSKDIVVVVRDDNLSVFVAGLYSLEVALGACVTEHPESLKFLRKRALLRVVLVTADGDDSAASTEGSGSTAPVADSVCGEAAAADYVEQGGPESRVGHDEDLQPLTPLKPQHRSDAAAVSPDQPSATGQAAVQGSDSTKSSDSCHTEAPIPAAATSSAQLHPSVSSGKVGLQNGGGNTSQNTKLKRGFFGQSPTAAASRQTPSASSTSAASCNEGKPDGTSMPAPGTADGAPATSQETQKETQKAAASNVAESTAAPGTHTASTVPPAPSDADMYEAAQGRLDAEAAAAFAEKAAALITSPPSIDATKRAIALLHKAVRLDGSHAGHHRKLLRAEQIADELRSQPPPAAAPPAPGTPQAAGAQRPPSPSAPASSRDSYSEGDDDDGDLPGWGPQEGDGAPSDASDMPAAPPEGIRAWFTAIATLCWLVLAISAQFVAHGAVRAAMAVIKTQAFLGLCVARFILSRRMLHRVQGSLAKHTYAAIAYHTVATVLMACCVAAEPLLITWPFKLTWCLWRQLLWAPYFLTSLTITAILSMVAAQTEPVLQLVMGWPLLLWAAGGGVWGLAGVACHVLLLALTGQRGASVTTTLCCHGLWTAFVWSLALRWGVALILAAVIAFAAVCLIACLPLAEEPVSDGTTGGLLRSEVPPGAVGEVARVLGALTHYDVLQVSMDADDAVIQKAKRVKLLACHPDKVGASVEGAGYAVARITSASAALNDPRGRARYDAELRATTAAAAANVAHGQQGCNYDGGYNGGPPPASSRATSRYPLHPDDPGILLPTRGRESVLQCPRVLLDKSSARQCKACSCSHPAKDEEIWVNQDKGWFGHRHMLYCHDKAIYDVSKWADEEQLWDRFPANSHMAMSVGHRAGGGGGGGKAPPQPAKSYRKKRGRRR